MERDAHIKGLQEKSYLNLLGKTAKIVDNQIIDDNGKEIAGISINEKGVKFVDICDISKEKNRCFVYDSEEGTLTGVVTGKEYSLEDLGVLQKELNEAVATLSLDTDAKVADEPLSEQSPESESKAEDPSPEPDHIDMDKILNDDPKTEGKSEPEANEKEQSPEPEVKVEEPTNLDKKALDAMSDKILDSGKSELKGEQEAKAGEQEAKAGEQEAKAGEQEEADVKSEGIEDEKKEVEDVAEEVEVKEEKADVKAEEVEDVKEDLEAKKDQPQMVATTVGGALVNLVAKGIGSLTKGPSESKAFGSSNKRSNIEEARVSQNVKEPAIVTSLQNYDSAMKEYRAAYSEYAMTDVLADRGGVLEQVNHIQQDLGDSFSDTDVLALVNDENGIISDRERQSLREVVAKANKSESLKKNAETLQASKAALLAAAGNVDFDRLSNLDDMPELLDDDAKEKVKASMESIGNHAEVMEDVMNTQAFSPNKANGDALCTDKKESLISDADQQTMMEDMKRAMDNMKQMLDKLFSRLGLGS